MPQPATRVASVRIMMRPVHDAAFVVPDIFTFEDDSVSAFKAVNTGRKIDVVRDQHGMAMAGIEQETLVPAALGVIGKHFHDAALGLYRHILKPSGIGLGDAVGATAVGHAFGAFDGSGNRAGGLQGIGRTVPAEGEKPEPEQSDQKPFLHMSVRERAGEHMELGIPDPAVFLIERLCTGIVNGG